MSALVRLLYPLPIRSNRPAAIIRWWERRRLAYNVVVGGAGLVTVVALNALSFLPPLAEGLFLPLFGVVVYGALANLCYTAGWTSEIVFRAWWGDDPPDIGPVLFRQGLIFSVGLTLLPILIGVIAWIVRAVWVLI